MHFSNVKKGRPTKANVLAITSEPPILGFMLKPFVTGLVNATVTEVTTNLIWRQIINKVEAAVLDINEERIDTAISVFKHSNADFL